MQTTPLNRKNQNSAKMLKFPVTYTVDKRVSNSKKQFKLMKNFHISMEVNFIVSKKPGCN